MLGSTYTDLRRGTVLVRALLVHEITIREFRDAAGFLEPEAIQVLGTVLALANDEEGSSSQAHTVCQRLAARMRNLN
jgi:hypothetical protein